MWPAHASPAECRPVTRAFARPRRGGSPKWPALSDCGLPPSAKEAVCRADHAGVRLVPLRYLLALSAVAVACVGVFALSGRSIERQKRDRAHEAAEIVTATISSQVASAEIGRASCR